MHIEDKHSKEHRLVISAALNATTTVAQIIGGILSGSLSLISDALHNFSDTVALVISFFAVRLAKRKNTEAQTFGYKRAEILAALFNACALVVISIFLFKEAIARFAHPYPINTVLMLSVAFAVIDTVVVFIFLGIFEVFAIYEKGFSASKENGYFSEEFVFPLRSEIEN